MASAMQSTPDRRLQLLLATWVITVVIGAVMLLVSASTPAPLVGAAGWEVNGFFKNSRPSSSEVSPAIVNSSEAAFYRSWSPSTGSVPGRVATPWFTLGGSYLWIPIVGYPTNTGIAVYLQCESSGQRTPLATGNPHDHWSQRLFRRPSGCDGRIRIVAESNTRSSYVGIGTPFSATWLDRLRATFPTQVALHLYCFVLIGLPFLAAAVVSERVVGRGSEVAFSCAVVCALGYLAFFVAFASNAASRWFSVAILILSTGILISKRTRTVTALKGMPGRALFVSYVLSLTWLAIVALADTGAGPWNPNYRFDPAVWSTDNHLPALVSEGIYVGKQVGTVLGGGWRVSDRPPLMAGILLLQRPLWAPLVFLSPDRLPVLYLSTGIVLQVSSILAAISLVRSLWPKATLEPAAAIAVFASPFFLFNVAYTWPKLLSAGLALIGMAVLVRGGKEPQGLRPSNLLLGGSLFGFALLSHAGVAFGLIALPVFFWCMQRRTRILELACCAFIAAVLWLPWALWQQHIDPPGNALTKFALAGTFGFDDPQRPLTAVVRDTYAGLTVKEWLETRNFALLTIIGARTPEVVQFVFGRADNVLGNLRANDFLFVAPALRALLLAVVAYALLVVADRKTRVRPEAKLFFALLVGGGTGLLVNALVTWSVHIQHHHSYLAICMLYCAALVALVGLPTALRRFIVFAQLGYVGIVWLAGPFTQHPLDMFVVPFSVLCVVATLWLTFHACGRWAASDNVRMPMSEVAGAQAQPASKGE